MRLVLRCAILGALFCSEASAAGQWTRDVMPGEVRAAIHACANKEVLAEIIAHPGRFTPFANRPLSVGEAKWIMIRKAVQAYGFKDDSIENLWEVSLNRAQLNPGAGTYYDLCIYTARLAQVKK